MDTSNEQGEMDAIASELDNPTVSSTADMEDIAIASKLDGLTVDSKIDKGKIPQRDDLEVDVETDTPHGPHTPHTQHTQYTLATSPKEQTGQEWQAREDELAAVD